jgi:hypothetical protein
VCHQAITKIHTTISLSVGLANCKVWQGSFGFHVVLDLIVVPSFHSTCQIIPIFWRASGHSWTKVNTNGFIVASVAACGGTHPKSLGTLLTDSLKGLTIFLSFM